jgi:hypothetical protein
MSMRNKILWPICLSLIFALGGLGSAAENTGWKPISLIALIANPEKYHGKEVTVVGVARLEPEDHMLYLSPSDAEQLNETNGVWLEFGDVIRLPAPYAQRAPKLNRHWVVVRGTFDMNDHGHLGLIFNGAITEIKRLQYLPKPEPRGLKPH